MAGFQSLELPDGPDSNHWKPTFPDAACGGGAAMKFECPECHQRLSAPDGAVGTTVRCPSCDHRFEIPSETVQPEEEAAPAAGAKKPATPKAKPKSERKA